VLAPDAATRSDGVRRPANITFWGHATVLIELDGARFLTDPLLRRFLAGLVHRAPVQDVAPVLDGIDAVLISHLHHDHLDLPSLKLLSADVELIVPSPGREVVKSTGLPRVREVAPGETVEVRGVRVHATLADHYGRRAPFGPVGDSLGFLIEGSERIYFAGDTDVFDEMAELAPVDVALLPIAGWGPRLGPGHMGPVEAVKALELLRPRIAIPIHWGSLVPLGLHLWSLPYLTRPPVAFTELASEVAPQVEIRVLEPGQTLAL
jgi:L-ascorbate metabolism protein UlaG (beta-lactamase superfamily)